MRAIVIGLAMLAAAPASAEVVRSSPNGFEVRHAVDVPLSPQRAWTAFEQVGSWWDGEHTYSGNAANMRMALSIGACLCEIFEETGGGIEHLRVVYADPHKRAVLTGGLGPLLYEAVAGVMDIKVDPAAGGSRVTMTYKVAGFAAGNGDKMAPLVDQVLGEQMKRYGAYAAREAKRP